MMAIANPVIALAVNQLAYPPDYDPDIDYTDKECAKMFPNFSEGYYDCKLAEYLIQVLNYSFLYPFSLKIFYVVR